MLQLNIIVSIASRISVNAQTHAHQRQFGHKPAHTRARTHTDNRSPTALFLF